MKKVLSFLRPLFDYRFLTMQREKLKLKTPKIQSVASIVGELIMEKYIKKRFILIFTAVLIYPQLSVAEFTGGKSNTGIETVQQFREQCDLKTEGKGLISGLLEAGAEGAKCDEKKFTLQGHIVSQIDGDLYEFKDETGSVSIEVNDFKGVDVGPDDLILISGEADYEETGLTLDVRDLELVK